MSALLNLMMEMLYCTYEDKNTVMSVLRYYIDCYRIDKVKYIVIGQDPYKSYVLPKKASAFAYQPTTSDRGIPPSIQVMVDSVINYKPKVERYRNNLVRMFTRSYEMLDEGVIFINSSYSTSPSSPSKVRETLLIASMLREIIITRKNWAAQKIVIITLGAGAQGLGSMLSSSLNGHLKVTIVKEVHPAYVARQNSVAVGAPIYMQSTRMCNIFIDLCTTAVVHEMSNKKTVDKPEVLDPLAVLRTISASSKTTLRKLDDLEKSIDTRMGDNQDLKDFSRDLVRIMHESISSVLSTVTVFNASVELKKLAAIQIAEKGGANQGAESGYKPTGPPPPPPQALETVDAANVI